MGKQQGAPAAPAATVISRSRSMTLTAAGMRGQLTLADLELLVHTARAEGYRSDAPVGLLPAGRDPLTGRRPGSHPRKRKGLMYSLAKFAHRTGQIGNPLPDPFPTFGTNRVQFRRGGTSMIAGQPGSFKSMMALNMLVSWAAEGASALYFSADSDEFTVAKRVAGIITGEDSAVIEYDLLHGRHTKYVLQFNPLLAEVRFEYRALDIEQIADRMASFEHVNGAYPDVAFIDNLINYAESATDWGEMIDFLKELDSLARETKSHICVLHHASEGFPRGVPLPSAAIQGKVTQIPRLVLTTAAEGLALMVTCVKNTNGPQHPNAAHHMNFMVQPSMRVDDLDYAAMVGAA